jgi:hypothetical protein
MFIVIFTGYTIFEFMIGIAYLKYLKKKGLLDKKKVDSEDEEP